MRDPRHTAAVPRHLPLLLVVAVLGGCPARSPQPPPANAPAHDAPEAPLPLPHPALAALATESFELPDVGVSGRHPTTWYRLVHEESTVLLELSHGEGTWFALGRFEGVAGVIAEATKDLPPEEQRSQFLQMAAEEVSGSELFFAGCRKTLLRTDFLSFGDQPVVAVTMLIERPEGGIESLPIEQRVSFVAGQRQYIELAPEGERVLSRQWAWAIGADVWLAQMVAPTPEFLERVLEVEEGILPTLHWEGSASKPDGSSETDR